MGLDFEKLNKEFNEAMESMTDADWEDFFTRHPRPPEGWVDMEEFKPCILAEDFIGKGYTLYKVKNMAGEEFEVGITGDPNCWYYKVAKPLNITHWYNEQ